jgi:hypothetical protein
METPAARATSAIVTRPWGAGVASAGALMLSHYRPDGVSRPRDADFDIDFDNGIEIVIDIDVDID